MSQPYDDISSLVGYLPVHLCPRGQHPFTLITVLLPLGVVKQPPSNSRTFLDSCDAKTLGRKILDGFNKPSYTQVNASSVIGFLFSYCLFSRSHEHLRALRKIELELDRKLMAMNLKLPLSTWRQQKLTLEMQRCGHIKWIKWPQRSLAEGRCHFCGTCRTFKKIRQIAPHH